MLKYENKKLSWHCPSYFFHKITKKNEWSFQPFPTLLALCSHTCLKLQFRHRFSDALYPLFNDWEIVRVEVKAMSNFQMYKRFCFDINLFWETTVGHILGITWPCFLVFKFYEGTPKEGLLLYIHHSVSIAQVEKMTVCRYYAFCYLCLFAYVSPDDWKLYGFIVSRV